LSLCELNVGSTIAHVWRCACDRDRVIAEYASRAQQFSNRSAERVGSHSPADAEIAVPHGDAASNANIALQKKFGAAAEIAVPSDLVPFEAPPFHAANGGVGK
jgi:hypothetical protein